jgi:phosphoglycerate dehydrogenase-like enzyme
VKIAIPDTFRRTLEGRLPGGVHAAWYHDVQDVGAAASGADVLVIGFIEADEIRTAIASATSARWISTHAAGVDHYPFDLLSERELILTNGAGVNAPPIAEFVVLCVLSAAKSFPFFAVASTRREWPTTRPPADELDGARALVLGYGEIGRGVGERLRGFGIRVTGVRRTPSEEPDIIGPDDWRGRLGEFDYVLVTAALTRETRRMLGKAEFARMRQTAWLVNVSRGGLVDHDALAEALASGRPRGAYLDVTEPEPLPAEHPLWRTPNVVISGHSAGRSPRSQQRYASMFLDNLQRFQSGQPLRNLVDYSAGY